MSIYLHFKCYSLSWFNYKNLHLPPPPPASMRVLPHPPTHSHLTILAFTYTGTRVSPPIDAREGHPLLYMQLEPWVPACVLFGWWFSPWELWGVLVGSYCCSSYGAAGKHNKTGAAFYYLFMSCTTCSLSLCPFYFE